MPGSGEMIAMARIVEAASHGDEEPMRAWLAERNPPPDVNDAYLDIHSDEWHAFITADVASIPLPPGSDRREVFAVLYDELPVPASATPSHWSDVIGDWLAGGGLSWGQDSESGELVGVKRSGVQGQADKIAVYAWCTYWLKANQSERRSAQPVLNAMDTWPGLQRALYMSGNDRIRTIGEIAKAVRKNDPAPMREWLADALGQHVGWHLGVGMPTRVGIPTSGLPISSRYARTEVLAAEPEGYV